MVTQRTQELVVGGLRALVHTPAFASCFHAPLVEPNESFFPDAWTPDQDGVFRLVRRIMARAGLGDVPLSIERFVFGEDDESDHCGGGHVIAFFRGITDGRCEFGVNCTQLDDPEHLIGVLAHEVAHAFRAVHGLVVEDRDDEEELTDLTTIFLGFGIATSNNAHSESVHSDLRTVRRSGYLSPQAMAFALAMWLRVRDLKEDRDVVDRWLAPLQRSMFDKTWGRLRRDRLRRLIGVRELPAPPSDSPPMLADAPPGPPGTGPIDFSAKRTDTFRVRVRRQRFVAIVAALCGAVMAWAWGETLPIGLAIVVACAGLGYVVGRALSYDECARRECEVRIPRRAANCPRCGARVQGAIDDPLQVPDALEALRRRRVEARRWTN
jgi:hypothetical protein